MGFRHGGLIAVSLSSPISLTATADQLVGGAGEGKSRPPAFGGVRRQGPAILGVLPFAVYTLLFLGLPTVAITIGAFSSPAGGFTLHNLHIASTGVYLHGFRTSIELSIVTAVVPGIVGVLLAYAVHVGESATLRRIVATASGVFANFGGVPLAFLFIATAGTKGLATLWLDDIGLDPAKHGFNLYGFSGIALVYMYFQVPLMVLVITPALQGLKPAWREAADNLGANGWNYWRHVGGPVLLPAVLGSTLLLFGSAFSSYATADALTSGTVPLTAIQIGSFLNGNVLAGQENVGKALGFGMVVIITVLMIGYTFLQRRASRWLR
jgi:putative spermidine/putrescine transport system permease protein